MEAANGTTAVSRAPPLPVPDALTITIEPAEGRGRKPAAAPLNRTSSLAARRNASIAPSNTFEKPRVKRAARAELLPEYEILAIELTDAGSGYNADEPPLVTIAPPPNSTSVKPAQAAAKASVQMTARAGDLTPSELKAVAAALQPDSFGKSRNRFGPLTPPDDSVPAVGAGLPLPQLLPPTLTPKRAPPADDASAPGAYSLPVKVPRGAFGRSAPQPVEQRIPLQQDTGAKIFLAGGLCSATAHTALVPIDVVKTRMQAEPTVYQDGPIDCAQQLIKKEGIAAFAQGAGATAVGYALAGSLSFGLLEVFSRVSTSIAGPGNALFFSTPLLALSSVGATALCATAVCPFEAVRILSVTTGRSSAEVLRQQIEAEGFASLFRGLPPILLKEVPFVVTKFVVFDQVSTFAAGALPDSADAALVTTALPVFCGAVAGVFAVLASQPADVVLTRTNEEGATLSESVAAVSSEPSLVLQGLGARLLFGVLLVSLQFLFYSQLRDLFGVSKADLTLVWDTLAVLRKDGGI